MNSGEPAMNAPLLEARRLEVDIGGHRVCRALDWRVDAGESWAILGRNGVGKSTLLATLAGFRAQQGGFLSIAGQALPEAGHGAALRSMARVRGYLSQHQFDPFASTVLETVLVGRHPHLGRWDWESAADRRIAEAALTELDLDGFAEREVQTLSGGERQRLAVAQLLTQEPQLFLLDEHARRRLCRRPARPGFRRPLLRPGPAAFRQRRMAGRAGRRRDHRDEPDAALRPPPARINGRRPPLVRAPLTADTAASRPGQ
jgi:ABC-type molybdenum transport system ATPase subunit/photorepair protein PhrA